MNNNQKMAFAIAAEEENRRSRKVKPKKKPSNTKGTMKPVSRKGKNKFKY